MNETLEAMAQAIFEDCFVHFRPTRTKSEGRERHLPPDLWNLFPDTSDDDGKPIGWTTYTLGARACHHRATLSPIADPDRRFHQVVQPCLDRLPSSRLQTATLVRTRNRLLPKVISGEIRVAEAGSVVETVV